jgi:hypothetical protein
VIYIEPTFACDMEAESMTEAKRATPERRTGRRCGHGQLGRPPGPGRERPYLRLSRADRPIGTWLLLLPCWWGLLLASALDGGRAGTTLWIALGCGIGAWLMRGAGCTWNDITDRDIDGGRAHPLAADSLGAGQRDRRRWSGCACRRCSPSASC